MNAELDATVRYARWSGHQCPDSDSHHQAWIRGRDRNRARWNDSGRASTVGASPPTTLAPARVWICRAAQQWRSASAPRPRCMASTPKSPPIFTCSTRRGSACARLMVWWYIVVTVRHCPSVDGRSATSPAWTAVEVARQLRRPRALATLDAALRSGTCHRAELWRAAVKQAGRRGIVAVRDLIPLADARAESPMESEARLAMIDGELPIPELAVRARRRQWRAQAARFRVA